MTEVDSDGYPVVPWSSRFVEVGDLAEREQRMKATKDFVDAVVLGSARMNESFVTVAEMFRRAALVMNGLFVTPEEIATRRAVQAQRRRRHR